MYTIADARILGHAHGLDAALCGLWGVATYPIKRQTLFEVGIDTSTIALADLESSPVAMAYLDAFALGYNAVYWERLLAGDAASSPYHHSGD